MLEQATRIKDEIIRLRRDIHQHPELSFQEVRTAKLVADTPDDRKLLEELYLWTLTRFPTAAEVERSLAYLKGTASRAEGYQDIVWSLLNRHEFLVNH